MDTVEVLNSETGHTLAGSNPEDESAASSAAHCCKPCRRRERVRSSRTQDSGRAGID